MKITERTNRQRAVFDVIRDIKDPSIIQEINIVLKAENITKEQATDFLHALDALEQYAERKYVKNGFIDKEIFDRFVRFTGQDYQQLFDAYIDKNTDLQLFVLQQRAQKAMHYYIREDFFVHYSIADIDQAIQKMQDKYTLLKTERIQHYKSKEFIDRCVYVLLDEFDEQLPQATQKIVDTIIATNPGVDIHIAIREGVIQAFLLGACNDQLIMERFSYHRNTITQQDCQQIQEKTLLSHIKKDFFMQHKDLYYGGSDAFTTEMDTYVASILPKYDLLSGSTRYRYKARSFYKEAQEQYIDYCRWCIQKAILEDQDLFEHKDIYKTIDSRLFSVDTYKTFIKQKLQNTYETYCVAKKKRLEIENEKKQIRKTLPLTYNISNNNITPSSQSITLTPIQAKKLQELEAKMLDRIKIDMRYITRMIKKGGPIHIESLVEDMGQGYSQALLDELIILLKEFDVQIITIKEKGNTQKQTQEVVDKKKNEVQTTTNVQSKNDVLDYVIQFPETLTGYSLLQILYAQGYRFISTKEFIKQAEEILGSKARNSAIPIQKKMADALRMGDVVREKRNSGKGRNCANYEVLVFEKEGIRLVKQGKTILWLLDHKTYQKKINSEFTQNNKNYDNPLLWEDTTMIGFSEDGNL